MDSKSVVSRQFRMVVRMMCSEIGCQNDLEGALSQGIDSDAFETFEEHTLVKCKNDKDQSSKLL